MDNEQHDSEINADVWTQIGTGFSTYLNVTETRIVNGLLSDADRAAIVMEEEY